MDERLPDFVILNCAYGTPSLSASNEGLFSHMRVQTNKTKCTVGGIAVWKANLDSFGHRHNSCFLRFQLFMHLQLHLFYTDTKNVKVFF